MSISFTIAILACMSFHNIHARRLIFAYDRIPLRKSCTSSQQCPSDECCRANNGNLIGDPELGWGFPVFASNTASGTCSAQKSGPGQVCLSQCGCTEGYDCYRTITGACCPPRTCWKKEAADADREFWRNCHPPKCQFPPSANPGSGGPLI